MLNSVQCLALLRKYCLKRVKNFPQGAIFKNLQARTPVQYVLRMVLPYSKRTVFEEDLHLFLSKKTQLLARKIPWKMIRIKAISRMCLHRRFVL